MSLNNNLTAYQQNMTKLTISKCFSFIAYRVTNLFCTFEYLCEFSYKFEMGLIIYSEAWAKLIQEKSLKSKNSCQTPFLKGNTRCAAKAFYSCPAIISRRPESQKIPKEPQLNPEEESKIIQARSHVTLEKSSRNYKPSEE
jgi:hypothetical protein